MYCTSIHIVQHIVHYIVRRVLKRWVRCRSDDCRCPKARSLCRRCRLLQRSSTVSTRRSSCRRTTSCSDSRPPISRTPTPTPTPTPMPSPAAHRETSSCRVVRSCSSFSARRRLQCGRRASTARTRSCSWSPRSFCRSTRRRVAHCRCACPRRSSAPQCSSRSWRSSSLWRSCLVFLSLRTAFLLGPCRPRARPLPPLVSPPPKRQAAAAADCRRRRRARTRLPECRATHTYLWWSRLCIFRLTSEFVCRSSAPNRNTALCCSIQYNSVKLEEWPAPKGAPTPKGVPCVCAQMASQCSSRSSTWRRPPRASRSGRRPIVRTSRFSVRRDAHFLRLRSNVLYITVLSSPLVCFAVFIRCSHRLGSDCVLYLYCTVAYLCYSLLFSILFMCCGMTHSHHSRISHGYEFPALDSLFQSSISCHHISFHFISFPSNVPLLPRSAQHSHRILLSGRPATQHLCTLLCNKRYSYSSRVFFSLLSVNWSSLLAYVYVYVCVPHKSIILMFLLLYYCKCTLPLQ